MVESDVVAYVVEVVAFYCTVVCVMHVDALSCPSVTAVLQFEPCDGDVVGRYCYCCACIVSVDYCCVVVFAEQCQCFVDGYVFEVCVWWNMDCVAFVCAVYGFLNCREALQCLVCIWNMIGDDHER